MNTGNVIDVLTVEGPTASGKTAVAIELAARLKGEIVSADSMAVYKYMNVGTAKPDALEQSRAVFHLIDCVEPEEEYNAGQYEADACRALEDIRSRGLLPILCGGSGLYIKAALEGLDSDVPQCDPRVRSLVERVYRRKGPDYMRELLRQTDPEIYARTDAQNPRRVLRLIEIMKQTGRTATEVFARPNARRKALRSLRFGLTMDRAHLYRRINERVDRMLAEGLEDEARLLMSRGSVTALQAIGYKEMAEYLRGECSLETAAENIRTATRHLAKRQISWFGREKSIIWIDMEKHSPRTAAEEIIRRLEDEVRL
ncbi:MAG: tRNA (adenosine(37)-N6)-dimethylallyltransferase MiaA [Abditibacteriota bacterium]|nr:tRNA (adenosine(37)-N6)-dimethylallyltransferase MiaA [Abditibacteriota bacterium]